MSTAPLPETPTVGVQLGASLNPQDDEGRMIYLSYARDSCYVNLPFPTDEIRPPGTAPPQQTVPCPPLMADPAWLACPGGLIAATAEDACLCDVAGNPPPPARWVHCPESG